jgi:translation elongation factor EF-1beta
MAELSPKQIRKLMEKLNALHDPRQHILSVAIECGGILTQLKEQIGHGGWRMFVRENLTFGLRTAQIYMQIWQRREELTDADNIKEALELIKRVIKKERGRDAVEADYHKIQKTIVKPIRLARRRFERLDYIGDSAEMMERIRAEIRNELEEFLFLFNQ